MAVFGPLDPGIERAFCCYGLEDKMAGKKPAEGSPESIARANRQRLALEEGARAMADVQQQGVAVRKNMERLRALRRAREAEEATAQTASPDISSKKRKKVLSK
jgi:hypothetical protein